MASSIAATEPLPLVPTMCTQGTARWGSPSSAASAVIFFRSNFAARACCGEASSRPSVSRYRTASWWVKLAQEKVEGRGNVGFQILAVDNGVEEAMLEQELGALETFGQLLADGLLDHARPGKADQRAGLGNVQIAQHGVAGGDASGGRVGEHGDVGHAHFVQPRQRRRDFGE